MYRKESVITFLLAFLILTTYYLLPTTAPKALAQESLGLKALTVVPPTVTVNVNPGYRSEGTIKLINDSDNPLTFAADTQDFIVTDQRGIPTILPPNSYSNKYSAAAWLAVAPSVFTINPHEKIILNYYMQVPANARPGGHYAAVLFKPQTPGAQQTTGSSVVTDIGTLFAVHIAGPITEKAEVTSMRAPGFSEYGPISIKTLIKNLGDSDITPKGTVTFYNMFGQRIGASFVDEHRVFPEAIREFTNSFGQKWSVGRFTARLVASYGQANNLPLTAEVSFVIFPWKVAVVAILVIAAAILGYLVWRKRKKKDDGEKETESTTLTPNAEIPHQ